MGFKKNYKNQAFFYFSSFFLSFFIYVSSVIILLWHSSWYCSCASSCFCNNSIVFCFVNFSLCTDSFNFSYKSLILACFYSLWALARLSKFLLNLEISSSKHSFSFSNIDIFDLYCVLSFIAYLAEALYLSTCRLRSRLLFSKSRMISSLWSTSYLNTLSFWLSILDKV